jgi:ubiquinone/menaquinone biosynthesis C-methylase UbiE
MTDLPKGLQRHYGGAAIVQRVLTAVADSGHDVSRLTAEMLYPYDQFHWRSLAATRENATKLRLDASMHLLDVGSGVGGPARYMASTFGCRVTGIDLTEEFVAAAKELTERCSLSDKVAFRQGDALAMPFSEGSFDAACCLNVAMNIKNKAGLAREIRRTLKPRARLVWTEATEGSGGPPHYPLPWARNPDISFLVSARELRSAIEGAALRIVEWMDETAATRGAFTQAGRSPESSASSMISNRVVMGDDFAERLNNFGRSVLEERLVPICAIAERG